MHFLARNRVVWRSLRQNWCARLGGNTSQELPPPKKIAESLCPEGRKITHAQKQNPWTNSDKILQGSNYPRPNHLHKFWWPSVKGFFGWRGQIFPFSIDFHRLPYNTRTTMRVCEPTFDRFSRTPACNRQAYELTDRRTDRTHDGTAYVLLRRYHSSRGQNHSFRQCSLFLLL